MNDDVVEVYISVTFAYNKQSVQKIRVDCKNKKIAIGQSYVYINGTMTQSMDFSKFGWNWTPPKNIVDKKLLKLVCKKK